MATEYPQPVGSRLSSPLGTNEIPDLVPVVVYAKDTILRSGLTTNLRQCPIVEVVDGQPATLNNVVVMVADEVDAATLAALRAIHRTGTSAIVVLASRLTSGQAEAARDAGACRWLARTDATRDHLQQVVSDAFHCAHGTDEHSQAWTPLIDEHRRDTSAPTVLPAAHLSLSPRDLDVLRRIAEGQSTASIATDLAYSESTIKNVVHSIVEQFGAKNRTHAVTMGVRSGLI